MSLSKKLPIVLLLLAALTAPASALEVDRKILPNGLTVLHSERRNLPLVMVTLLVKAGLIEEPKEGLSNMTASLLTEGTKTRTSTEISEEVDFIGAGLGASADTDYITITLSVLKKDVDKGFELFSDVLLNPSFPDTEIDRKKTLTKGSLKQSDEDPSYLAQKAFNQTVYGGHPYGKTMRGTEKAIDDIKKDDILGFYGRYFVSGNSIMTVVGDLSPAELDGLIKKYLGGWKGSAISPKDAPKMPELSPKLVKIDKDLTQATVNMGHMGVSRDNPDYYALTVMNYILGGGGFSSRLMSKVRDEKGLAYDIHTFFAPHKEPGVFQVGFQTKNKSANEVIKDVLAEMKAVINEGVTDTELDEAKSYLIGSFPRRIDAMRKIADFLASVEFFGLGLDYIEKYPEMIKKVDSSEIKRVAKKYLHPENMVIVVVSKQSEAGIKGPQN